MNTEQNEERSTEDVNLPGDMLRQAREKLGYSQADVASRLRLRQSVVDDIENNKFEETQLATFTRGYVRSYAKFVGIDENEVLVKLDAHGHAQPQEQEMQSFSRRTKREAHDSRVMRLTWVLAALFIGVTGVWWWQSLHIAPEVELTTTSSQQPQPLDESLANAGNSNNPVLTPVVVSETPEQETSAVSAIVVEENASAENAAAPQASFDDSFTVPEETAAGDSAISADSTVAPSEPEVVSEVVAVEVSDLELTFSGDCWIDVRDATGKHLDTGIKKAGDVLKLDGDAPFRVVLGAPSVVTMSYQGKPVDLSRYPASKVARLKLPQ